MLDTGKEQAPTLNLSKREVRKKDQAVKRANLHREDVKFLSS